jgi:Bacterial regulatory proteins, gntR family
VDLALHSPWPMGWRPPKSRFLCAPSLDRMRRLPSHLTGRSAVSVVAQARSNPADDDRNFEEAHATRRPESFQPVHKTRASRAIEAQVRALVAGGQAQPGDRLPSERALAQALGVGLSTLREAVRILEIVGLLDVRPGEDTFVAEPATRLPGSGVRCPGRRNPIGGGNEPAAHSRPTHRGNGAHAVRRRSTNGRRTSGPSPGTTPTRRALVAHRARPSLLGPERSPVHKARRI